LDIKQLEQFLQVYKNKSITKAAETLYISQQGLSTSVSKLEKELGCKLFRRTSKGIFLTKHGEYFLPQVEKIIDILNESLTYLNGQISKKSDLLIGCSYGVVGELYDGFLLRDQTSNPEIRLKINEYPDILCELAVENEEVELGIIVGPVNDNQFDSYLLLKRKFYAIVHKSHPLAKLDIIDLEKLKTEKIIIMNKNFKIYHIFYESCLDAGFAPNIVYEAAEIALVHKMVGKNYGIGLTVDFLLDDIQVPDLKVIDVGELKYSWDLYLITKKNSTLSKSARVFKSYITNKYHVGT